MFWASRRNRAKLAELSRSLELAESRLRAIGETRISADSRYESATELANFIQATRERIAAGSRIRWRTRRELWLIFAPTCDWDDLVGDAELGTRVFESIDALWNPLGVPRW